MGISTSLLRTSLTAELCARTQMFETGWLSVFAPQTIRVLTEPFSVGNKATQQFTVERRLATLQPEHEAFAAPESRRTISEHMRVVVRAAIVRAEARIEGKVGLVHRGAAPSAVIQAEDFCLDAEHPAVQAGELRDTIRAGGPDRISTCFTMSAGLPLSSWRYNAELLEPFRCATFGLDHRSIHSSVNGAARLGFPRISQPPLKNPPSLGLEI